MLCRRLTALVVLFCLPWQLYAQDEAAMQLKIQELQAQLDEAQKELTQAKQENAALKSVDAKAVPYLDFETLTGLLGELHTLSVGDGPSEAFASTAWLPSNISEHWATVTEQAMLALDGMKEKATALSASAAEAAQGATEKATKVAQDLHKSLEPHIGDHFEHGMKAYKEDLEPHVETAREVASIKLREAQEMFKQGSSALLESSTTAVGSLTDNMQVFRLLSSDVLGDYQTVAGEKVRQAMAPAVYTVGGRTFRFGRGLVDMIAAGTQLLLFAYLLFILVWRIFLRTVLWKLGMKLFGRNMMALLLRTLRLCISVLRACLRLLWGTFMQLLGMTMSLTTLSFTTLVFLGIVYGVEVSVLLGMGLSKGLKLRYRLAISGALGLLTFLVMVVRGRMKRAKKSNVNGSNGSNGKAKHAEKPAPAKSQPKAEAKKQAKK